MQEHQDVSPLGLHIGDGAARFGPVHRNAIRHHNRGPMTGGQFRQPTLACLEHPVFLREIAGERGIDQANGQ